ncbi:binding-protein-dependent transport systems inner membrane component [Denitrovibrio acetiphilus DSM 12809]|uniref:Binding-protein-dependent transport systems inner membrane component n=1 Tax=Denitrovibrio acetiphilus (strain DSM 12809 / NBRC 114555 / N2460) TaxID=522772 RepID=D4H2F1_DENA2|nr:ABC transporter permease subunit [Denitrovibrio acetiphilus]ADD68942.1 binding-protein-dependent transport systems inner membrane component [Denitrovibrio acetiphilus DSM 12809]
MTDRIYRIVSEKWVSTSVGVLALIVCWQVLSLFLHEIVVASPSDTLISLIRLLSDDEFYHSLFLTVYRLFAGILAGSMAGLILGIAAGLNNTLKNILEPFGWVLMSIPPVIVTMLAMLWFGMGSFMVIFIASLLLVPFVYFNALKGMEMVDDNLLSMAKLYKYNFFMLLRHIYLPAISSHVLAGMTIVMGSGIRVVVLAELLGASDGIGFEVVTARSSIEVESIFAWAVVTLLIAACLEYVVLNPIQKRILRWKTI